MLGIQSNKISNELTDLRDHVLAIKAVITKDTIERQNVAPSSTSQVLVETKDLKDLFQQFNCAICLDLCRDNVPETTRCCKTMVCIACMNE